MTRATIRKKVLNSTLMSVWLIFYLFYILQDFEFIFNKLVWFYFHLLFAFASNNHRCKKAAKQFSLNMCTEQIVTRLMPYVADPFKLNPHFHAYREIRRSRARRRPPAGRPVRPPLPPKRHMSLFIIESFLFWTTNNSTLVGIWSEAKSDHILGRVWSINGLGNAFLDK